MLPSPIMSDYLAGSTSRIELHGDDRRIEGARTRGSSQSGVERLVGPHRDIGLERSAARWSGSAQRALHLRSLSCRGRRTLLDHHFLEAFAAGRHLGATLRPVRVRVCRRGCSHQYPLGESLARQAALLVRQIIITPLVRPKPCVFEVIAGLAECRTYRLSSCCRRHRANCVYMPFARCDLGCCEVQTTPPGINAAIAADLQQATHSRAAAPPMVAAPSPVYVNARMAPGFPMFVVTPPAAA